MIRKYRVSVFIGLKGLEKFPKKFTDVDVEVHSVEPPSDQVILTEASKLIGARPKTHWCEIKLIEEREE